MQPISLVPAEKKLASEKQDYAIKIAREMLQAAENGEVEEFVVLCRKPGDEDRWFEIAAPTNHFLAWIGRLEYLKAGWLALYERCRG
jgi:hypothetical protein